jgi:L,D-peptidoglycan transpeptidase YkuD (ErfK/YbiS/YcfS/YnhG family)
MPYIQVTDEDIWINDSKSDDYNKLVKKNKNNMTIFENMKRDDNLYEYGIVIEYNTEKVEKGKGSAIFFHVWGWPCTTTGCVALEEGNILKILEWLDPDKNPLVIIGSEGTLESILRDYIKNNN